MLKLLMGWSLLAIAVTPAWATTATCEHEYDGYLNDVRRQVFSHWKPVKSTRSYRVKLHLKIGKNGDLLTSPAVVQTSGNQTDDQTALSAARQRFAPLPACQPSKAFDMDITLSYDLKL